MSCTCAGLGNTTFYSIDKDVNRGPIYIRKKPIHTSNHLYPSIVKKWSNTTPVMVTKSNGRIKMRTLCTITNTAKSCPNDINIKISH